MDLINLFDDYNNKIFIKDEFNTSLNLFLAKIESAMWDLNQLADANRARMSVLINNINDLINKGYFKSYKNYIDPYGKGYIDIVDSMNRLGETIIIGSKENIK